MGKFKQKLFSFMYGRYGIDELYYGFFVLWVLSAVLNLIVPSFLWLLLGTVAVFVMFYRAMSRNIYKRRAENEKFLQLWRPIKKWFMFQKDRIRDHKSFRYRKCKSCRAIMKLPNKKGKHTAVCPRCKNRNDVRIIF